MDFLHRLANAVPSRLTHPRSLRDLPRPPSRAVLPPPSSPRRVGGGSELVLRGGILPHERGEGLRAGDEGALQGGLEGLGWAEWLCAGLPSLAAEPSATAALAALQ